MEQAVEEIIKLCGEMGVEITIEQLRTKVRESEYVLKRALVAYGLRERRYPMTQIADFFHYKDHAAVYNLLKYTERKHGRKKEYLAITPFLRGIRPTDTLERQLKYHERMEAEHHNNVLRIQTALAKRKV